MATEKQRSYLEAERARAKGDLPAAVASYQEALARDPEDWKVGEALAEALFEAGQKREALKQLFQSSHRRIADGDYETATRLLNRMLEMDPGEELLVTRGVHRCLEEVNRKMGEAREVPAEMWEETRSDLEALVLDETADEFRVPSELLELAGRVPYAGRASARLALVLGGDVRVEMKSRELFVGSSDDSHLVLPGQGVEKNHARILEMDGHFFLYERDGRTLRNGERVDIVELRDGDRVRFGEKGPEARVEIQDRS